jgi:hypothetical protein
MRRRVIEIEVRRRYGTAPTPGRVVAAAAAFGLVVGALVVGWDGAAVVAAVGYVVLSGRPGGTPPPLSAWLVGAGLLALTAGASARDGRLVLAVVVGLTAALSLALGLIVGRVNGRGGAIG